MVYPKLCQSTTSRVPHINEATIATTREGIAGGVWTNSTSGVGIPITSMYNRWTICPTTLIGAQMMNGSLANGFTSGENRCKVIAGLSCTRGMHFSPRYPTNDTWNFLPSRCASGRELSWEIDHAWYCMRGERPTSPRTRTAACRVDRSREINGATILLNMASATTRATTVAQVACTTQMMDTSLQKSIVKHTGRRQQPRGCNELHQKIWRFNDSIFSWAWEIPLRDCAVDGT